MDKMHYAEMTHNLEQLIGSKEIESKKIYLFGHCNATEELIMMLLQRGYQVQAILDNNVAKHGMEFKGIPIASPDLITKEQLDQVIVCIVARAYAAMKKQLCELGYNGRVVQLVNYDSYAEYSLEPDIISKRMERVKNGITKLQELRCEYPESFIVFCPFSALGDVYFAMSYLSYFLQHRNIKKYVVCVVGKGCADVARLWDAERIKLLHQHEMDEMIQASLYAEDKDFFIAHHDRPYVINLAKALYIKKIPLDSLYRCGVFGLDKECTPMKPTHHLPCKFAEIVNGKSVILSPYAKSVTNISMEYWEKIIKFYSQKNYRIFTNVVGAEVALKGTLRLELPLGEMKSAAEKAGTFIGLRSGLCDVIRDAKCKKIALYPDCYYSDTKWKMNEIYYLEGWENVVVK